MQKANLLLLLVVATSLISCKKDKHPEKKIIAKVKIAQVESELIPITLPAIGHIRAFNSAQIKAQVEGVLQKVDFIEGHEVQEGQLLFQIDPAPYQAKLEEANASLAEDTAKLKYMSDKVFRYKGLLQENFVSQLDFEQYVEQQNASQAQVMRDKADVNLAKINLNYCFIKAPFSGIISKKLIDKGNLISNDGKTLALINQINPIYVDFSIPEDSLELVMQKQAKAPLTFQIKTSDKHKIYTAKLAMIDNSVNENTGMILLRGELENKERQFWPGQFCSVSLLIEKKQALIIPSKAVSINEKGHYVFVVSNENKAILQYIETGQTIDSMVEVVKGLKIDEKVVTQGQINVMPNAQVLITNK